MTYAEEIKTIWCPEYDQLSIFNSERARGIVHSEEYQRRMDTIQHAYNDEIQNIARKHCMTVLK